MKTPAPSVERGTGAKASLNFGGTHSSASPSRPQPVHLPAASLVWNCRSDAESDGTLLCLTPQRAVAHLHRLGLPLVLEALLDVAAGDDLDDVLADFSRLDASVVRALGGDRFPPSVFSVSSS